MRGINEWQSRPGPGVGVCKFAVEIEREKKMKRRWRWRWRWRWRGNYAMGPHGGSWHGMAWFGSFNKS